MKYVNCGCGEKYSHEEEWINVDFNSYKNDVKRINLLGKLPFGDNSIDGFFSSCMLEHFTLNQAKRYLSECYRCLRPQGIIRIVVPDLEDVCREYLNMLNGVRKNEEEYKKRYEYVLIELIDQMTRTYSGGLMKEYWETEEMDKCYVEYRTGFPEGYGTAPTKLYQIVQKVIKPIKMFLERFPVSSKYMAGKFATSGELHKWGYDSYNMQKLLETCGFHNIEIMRYNESNIPNWGKYRLEIKNDGTEYKPHSLYVEAIKLQ